MIRHRRLAVASPVAATLAIVLGIALAGCSDSNKSTNPPPGGTTLELNSGNLAPNAQYVHRFFTAGSFPYHCTIHPTMTAIVSVSDAAPVADTAMTVSITGLAFSPTSTVVHTGGTVTWTNLDPTAHTVTSN